MNFNLNHEDTEKIRIFVGNMENNVSVILEGLNPAQKDAVQAVEGPVLIVAGAGSGKTRVLTSRVAYLLANGVDPSRILALTFTKKAAGEMKERIALMVGEKRARRVVMGTFHSVFVRFLRKYAASLGYPDQFTIYDTSDSTSAIKVCLKELKLDQDKNYKPKDVLARISNAKNNLVTWDRYSAREDLVAADRRAQRGRMAELYRLYQQKLKASGVMDFDDILVNMNILLRDNQEALQDLASSFHYIMVDEYQDTNFSQYVILKKLSMIYRNICVVGDDSQSIYAFRGAKIENILNFRKDYPECKVFRLEKNYRSTANIVNAANSLIAKNENRIPKNCVAVGGTGEKIRILCSFSEQEEALRIASEIIARMQQDHAKYQDFAILYRTNSQSRALEEALRKRNLPYVIYSGNSFFERSEVKDMMAYFKLVVNIHDDESFKRVVNTPSRGIGDTSLGALAAMARDLGTSMFKAAYSEKFAEYGLKAPAVARIRSFCDMIGTFAAKAGNTDASELAAALSDACGLHAHFKSDPSIESQSRASNVEELLNSVTAFIEERQNEYLQEIQEESQIVDETEVTFPLVTLGEFLENISLLTAVDSTGEEDARNRVALMTAHSAKGLEFPYVFVAGMEENLFPSGGMLSTPTDIEEERRLFYVAMTRAEEAVYLSYAQTRMRNGKHESNAPSRFLREIAPQYIENPLRKEELHAHTIGDEDDPGYSRGFRFGGGGPFGSSTSVTASSTAGVTRADLKNRPLPPAIENFVPDTMDKFKVGDRIEHNRFGEGKILEITGRIPELKAKIVFDKYGEKILLLKFAKIRLLPL